MVPSITPCLKAVRSASVLRGGSNLKCVLKSESSSSVKTKLAKATLQLICRPCFFALAAPPLWSPIQDIFTPAFITVYIHNKTRGIRSMYVVRMIAYYYL